MLMLEKSPALICAWEGFQFLDRSSRNFGPRWILWSFASNRWYKLDIMISNEAQQWHLSKPPPFVCISYLYWISGLLNQRCFKIPSTLKQEKNIKTPFR